MKKLIFVTFFIFLFSISVFAADVGVLLKVPGITWPGTAYRVSSTLQKINGVKIVNPSVPKKEVYVKYDNSKVKLKELLSALEKAGYSAKVLKENKWDLI